MAAGSPPDGEARLTVRTALPPGAAVPADNPSETPAAPAGIAVDPMKKTQAVQTWNERTSELKIAVPLFGFEM